MSPTNFRIPVGSTILVTGALGLVGSAVVGELAALGYKVRGTSRRLAAGQALVDKVNKLYGPGTLEIVDIGDLAKPESYKDAFKGVSGFMHIASDTTFSIEPDNYIANVVAGTTAIFKAALKEPLVKAGVLTSSKVVAYLELPGAKIEPDPYAPSGWGGEHFIKPAFESPVTDPMKPVYIYTASKVEAERAVWKIVDTEKPHFEVSSVLPDYVLGAPYNPTKATYSTSSWLKELFEGNLQSSTVTLMNRSQMYNHVQDCARIHVAALLHPDVKHERIWSVAGPISLPAAFRIWEANFPEMKGRWDEVEKGLPEQATIKIDNSRGTELLKWFGRDGWMGLEESVLETVKAPNA